MIKAGEADAITYIGINPEREKFIIFTPGNELSWVYSGLVILKTRKDEINYDGGSLTILKKYKFANLSGYIYGSAYDNAKLDKIETDTLEQLFCMIYTKRVDIGIVDIEKFKFRKKCKDDYLEDLIILQSPVKLANYIGFSVLREHQELAENFARAMLKYKKTKSFQRLQKKYNIKY